MSTPDFDTDITVENTIYVAGSELGAVGTPEQWADTTTDLPVPVMMRGVRVADMQQPAAVQAAISRAVDSDAALWIIGPGQIMRRVVRVAQVWAGWWVITAFSDELVPAGAENSAPEKWGPDWIDVDRHAGSPNTTSITVRFADVPPADMPVRGGVVPDRCTCRICRSKAVEKGYPEHYFVRILPRTPAVCDWLTGLGYPVTPTVGVTLRRAALHLVSAVT